MIEVFYSKNYDKQVALIRKTLKFNKHLAEDIVMESYMKAFAAIDSYDESKGAMTTWFNTILFNTLRDYQKKHKATVPLNEDTLVDPDTLENIVLLNEEINAVRNSLHRKVLSQFYWNGWTSNEISSATGLTRTNITTICNRFRRQIKNKYGVEL